MVLVLTQRTRLDHLVLQTVVERRGRRIGIAEVRDQYSRLVAIGGEILQAEGIDFVKHLDGGRKVVGQTCPQILFGQFGEVNPSKGVETVVGVGIELDVAAVWHFLLVCLLLDPERGR